MPGLTWLQQNVSDGIFFLLCSGNGKYATWGVVSGFVVMMVLDVGLG
jgi:zinc transporter ZupT